MPGNERLLFDFPENEGAFHGASELAFSECSIRVLNQTFNDLKLEKHPEKTVIGRTGREFDFLGYRFEPQGITLAKKTITNFITKALRLYEQEPPHGGVRRLGEYVISWMAWTNSGFARVSLPPYYNMNQNKNV